MGLSVPCLGCPSWEIMSVRLQTPPTAPVAVVPYSPLSLQLVAELESTKWFSPSLKVCGCTHLLGHIGCFEFCKIRQPPPAGRGVVGDQSLTCPSSIGQQCNQLLKNGCHSIIEKKKHQHQKHLAEITKRAASGSNTVI